jgi:hypothetical protein
MSVLAIILSLFCFLVTGPALVVAYVKYTVLLRELALLEAALNSIRQNHSAVSQIVAQLGSVPAIQEERLVTLERKIAAFQLMR